MAVLTKRSSLGQIRARLAKQATLYKVDLKKINPRPQNIMWIADSIRGQIAAAKPQDKAGLYWSLAVVLWAARQETLAVKAARMYLGALPMNDLDRASEQRQRRLRGVLQRIAARREDE